MRRGAVPGARAGLSSEARVVPVDRQPDHDPQRRECGALGEVHPLQLRGALRRADRWCEPALAVSLEDVLENRARLSDHDVAVFDGGQFSQRSFLGEEVRRRREELDGLEFVGKAEFFEQPQNADRAGSRRRCSPGTFGSLGVGRPVIRQPGRWIGGRSALRGEATAAV